jgi:AraC-type DNA-binding domain-containing proteins
MINNRNAGDMKINYFHPPVKNTGGSSLQTYDIIIDKNKKETTKHGSFEFPLAIYTTQINKNILGFIDWHWHEELQFCIITKGIVDFSVNGDSLILYEGDGLFINKEQLHKAKNYHDTDSSYMCLDFHSNLISSFAGSIINTKYIQSYADNSAIKYCILKNNIDWQSIILKKLLIIYQEYNNKEIGFELQIFISLLEVWQILLKSYFITFPNNEFSNGNSRIKKIIDYINNHYMEKIELTDLANEVNLSKSACCREFKRHMKCNIFEYIINYRLLISTKFLLTTNESITNIAYQCGFGSTSYFIEKFKKQTGVSPFVYRKEKIDNKESILTTM